MKTFKSWLRANGYDLLRDRDGSHWLADTGINIPERCDGENPALLVFCLKELDRRGLSWNLSCSHKYSPSFTLSVFASEFKSKHRAKTMTQAAINALVSTSGVKEE